MINLKDSSKYIKLNKMDIDDKFDKIQVNT